MASFLDMLLRPGGGTVDQVMRDAKAPRLPGPITAGSFMPSENIGEVGDRLPTPPQIPLAPHLTGEADPVMFAEPEPQAQRPTLPMWPQPRGSLPSADAAQPLDDEIIPPGVSEQRQPSPGGGLPVQPSGAPVSGQGAATPRAASPTQARLDEIKAQKSAMRAQKRQMLLAGAKLMSEKGGPASQVRASQLLFEIQKDIEAEQTEAQAEVEQQMLREDIDASPASDENKARARALLRFGPKASDIADALGSSVTGEKMRMERQDTYRKWRSSMQRTNEDTGVIEQQVDNAIKLLDHGTATTGKAGWVASWVPGSDAAELQEQLAPLRTLLSTERLNQMRQESPTGGALGSVTENEQRWLWASKGSLDPIYNSPKEVRYNLEALKRGARIVRRMKQLVPALDAGDPKANEEYDDLSLKLSRVSQDVRNRDKAKNVDVPSQNKDLDSRY